MQCNYSGYGYDDDGYDYVALETAGEIWAGDLDEEAAEEEGEGDDDAEVPENPARAVEIPESSKRLIHKKDAID